MKTTEKISPAQEQHSFTDKLHPWRVRITVAVAVIASIIVWIIPLRPTESAFEQRTLAKFPAFWWETLADGSYFDDISLWFSDTFPAREVFVNISSGVRRLFGIRKETIHGTVTEGDEIPVAPTRPSLGDTATTTTATTTTTTTQSAVTTTTKKPVTTQAETDIAQQNESLGAIIVKGDTAYEYYNFVHSTADRYIGIINRMGTKCGSANVYSMIVPTSIDVMLPANERPANSSDQGKAIAYMYGSLAQNILPVDVRDILLAHNEEYLYFHTDHHWTARGAYYAFTAFAQMQGKTPLPLTAYEEKAFSGFLGSFYADTQDAGLKLSGDTVIAYNPRGNISMVYGKSPAATTAYPVITDVTDWNPRYKYSTFVGGDQPYVCITNEDITDNSSIVLIKESYGNAFAPFLATMYHKVYILDYRYFTGDFAAFVGENNVSDVLLLNNISATRNNYLVGKLDSFVGQ